jgi:glycine hydroxymethyltransferase
VYLAVLKPGDKIMGMDLTDGGHLSHGKNINQSGMLYEIVSYRVHRETERLDMEQIREQALKEKPAMIVCGASAYPRKIDFAAFGEIAREVGCLLMADIAHIAGLVVGKVHPDPVPHADFVTTTNHKTLRGPRGGIILCRRKYAKAVDRAVFPGIQGGPLMHVAAAKAVAFREAMRPEFREYAGDIVRNAQALADALIEKSWRLVTGGTDNHLMLVDLRSRGIEETAQTAAGWLADAALIANANPIPYDPPKMSQWSGIRLGTPAVTTRELGVDEMWQLAGLIDDVLMSRGDAAVIVKVRDTVRELCWRFPIPAHYREKMPKSLFSPQP